MKIAAYNVENLFDRAKALNEDTAEAQKIVKFQSEITVLLEKEKYTESDKKRILELLDILGILKKDEGAYVFLRKIKGQLIKRPKTGRPTVVAAGRGDWIGWVELKTSHINEIAIMNTGRVIRDVDADIVAVVEAEHRVALKQFCDYVLQKIGGQTYPHVMLIDGNDSRGIDVGLMTKLGYNIGVMRSHIHDLDSGKKTVFSRDCPEYCIETPDGEAIWILPNHFKSKFGGNNQASINKRKTQAKRVAAIYKDLIASGEENVIVLGDLNDTPDSEALKPLLKQTNLKDISEHPSFDAGEFKGKGTFGLGNDRDKIDYLLLSPSLFARVSACGLFRKGAWPGKKPKPRWEVYPELEKEIHVASDHHVVWCEID